MYNLYNLEMGFLVEDIPDLDTAYFEFYEMVAIYGDLPSDTCIVDSLTGEVIAIIAK